MRMREVFYTSIALILVGAFVHNVYGGWLMGIGGTTLFGIGMWKLVRDVSGA